MTHQEVKEVQGLSAEEQVLFSIEQIDAPPSEEEPSTESAEQTTSGEPANTSRPTDSPTWPTSALTLDPVIPMTQVEPVWFATPTAEAEAGDSSSREAQRGWRCLSPARHLANPYPTFARSDQQCSQSCTTPRGGNSSSSSHRRGDYHSESQHSCSNRQSYQSSRRESPELPEFLPVPTTSSQALSMSLNDVHMLMSSLTVLGSQPISLSSTQVETGIHIDLITNIVTRVFIGPTPGNLAPYMAQPGLQLAHTHLAPLFSTYTELPQFTHSNAPGSSRPWQCSPSVRDGARSSAAGVGEHWDRPYA